MTPSDPASRLKNVQKKPASKSTFRDYLHVCAYIFLMLNVAGTAMQLFKAPEAKKALELASQPSSIQTAEARTFCFNAYTDRYSDPAKKGTHNILSFTSNAFPAGWRVLYPKVECYNPLLLDARSTLRFVSLPESQTIYVLSAEAPAQMLSDKTGRGAPLVQLPATRFLRQEQALVPLFRDAQFGFSDWMQLLFSIAAALLAWFDSKRTVVAAPASSRNRPGIAAPASSRNRPIPKKNAVISVTIFTVLGLHTLFYYIPSKRETAQISINVLSKMSDPSHEEHIMGFAYCADSERGTFDPQASKQKPNLVRLKVPTLPKSTPLSYPAVPCFDAVLSAGPIEMVIIRSDEPHAIYAIKAFSANKTFFGASESRADLESHTGWLGSLGWVAFFFAPLIVAIFILGRDLFFRQPKS